jgi:hypothetical protein
MNGPKTSSADASQDKPVNERRSDTKLRRGPPRPPIIALSVGKKKKIKLQGEVKALGSTPFSPPKTVDAALEALSSTKIAMDDIKEAQDLASSAPAAHEAHLVLIPQPSTHPRDPLVCDDVL